MISRMQVHNRLQQGLTLIELMIVLGMLLVIVAMFYPSVAHKARVGSRSSKLGCVNNLKQVGLSYRTWALDNNDRFPMETPGTNGGTAEIVEFAAAYLHFQVLSNELSTPKILLCPTDVQRKRATNFWPDLSNSKISYFVGIAASETNVQMFLSGDRNITNGTSTKGGFLDLTTNHLAGWDHQLHRGQGNIGLADGSVMQMSTEMLQKAIQNTGDSTNRLAMP